MDAWLWLVVYLLAFAVLQLFLYRRFSQRDSTPEPGFRYLDQSSASSDALETPDGDEVRCRHCGTPNAAHPSYRYCRECAQRLE